MEFVLNEPVRSDTGAPTTNFNHQVSNHDTEPLIAPVLNFGNDMNRESNLNGGAFFGKVSSQGFDESTLETLTLNFTKENTDGR